MKRLIYLVLIISIIYVIININIEKASNIKSYQDTFFGTVENIKEKDKNLEITLKINNEYLIGYLDKNTNNNLTLNDKVKVKGTLNNINNNTIPGLFNYKKYLYNNNTFYTINIEYIEIIKKNTNIFFDIKNKIINRINKYKSKNYIYAFILGDNSKIDNEIKNNYRNIGVSHLFAISGMHVSLISAVITIILKKLKISELKIYIISSIILLFYSFLVSFSPSVLRVVILYILLSIKKIFKKDIRIIELFLLDLSIMLFINPFYIFNTGFIYSFVISFYLIIFQDKLISKNYFISILKVSSFSFVVALPITIYLNSEINLLSILINIIYVPLITFIIFPLSIITFIVPILDSLLFYITNLFELVTINLNEINIFKIIMKEINILVIFLYYISITLMLFKKKFIIIFLSIFIIHYNHNLIFNIDKILVFDVKQGDSVLIYINNKTILLDTGNKNNNYINIINYLKKQGIRKIDYLIGSHGDSDHLGDAINIIKKIEVENVIFNCGQHNDLEKEIINELEKNKIKYYSCIKEVNIDKYKLEFLNTFVYDNENDNSNVIYFNYNNYKFLFMGDAGIKKEKDILDKYNLDEIYFLKVGHHGSNTSSSKYFIDKIKPKYSLISVGKNNRYGHPKDEVLDTLKNSKIYRTDLDGSIEIKLNKNGYKIRTCPP